MKGSAFVVACAFSAALPGLAADWPQYAGPNLDRSTPESIQKTWPASGPKVIWEIPASGGFSSFAVSGNKAFALTLRNVQGGQQEVLVAHDANTGKELWAAPLGTLKLNDGGQDGTADNKGGDGPRSTPAIDGNRVYVNSYRMVLACFDVESGKQLWSKDILKEYSGKNISWGNAASPVIDGDLVFAGGGGQGQSLLAFNKNTGALAWKKYDETITHATPIVTDLLGERQVIFFTQSGLVAVKPADGSLLWRHKFDYRTSTAASPVVGGDIVYCAAGYGVGASAVKVSKQGGAYKATELWRSRGNTPVANHWSTPVHYKGHLYGMFSFKEYGKGPLKCVELATGKVKWEKAGFGAGQVILAGDTVVALSDKGEIVQVQPTPDSYKEISRAKVVDGKCWSTPTLANGRLYVRSTKEAVCLDAAPKVAAE